MQRYMAACNPINANIWITRTYAAFVVFLLLIYSIDTGTVKMCNHSVSLIKLT